MLIGSNIGSEFASLPSSPWSMEPPRPPLTGGGGSLPPQSAMQLSPTGKWKYRVRLSFGFFFKENQNQLSLFLYPAYVF